MKNNVRQIRTLAIVLLFIILALAIIAGTYAKYTSSLSGTDSARVAHWYVNTTSNIEDLFAASYTNVTPGTAERGVIAPGTEGNYNFDIDGDVETAYTLKIEATGEDNVKNNGYSPIVYSFSDGTNTQNNLTFDKLLTAINAIDNGTAVHQPGNISKGPYTIGWKWAYESDSTDEATKNATDENDTLLGNSVYNSGEKTVSLSVKITATQAD